MNIKRVVCLAIVFCMASLFVGCGYTTPDQAQEVDVQGVVKGVDLKSAKSLKLKLNLLPMGGTARQVQFPLDETGKFSGKMMRGTYRYQINGPEGPDTIMKGIPEAVQKSTETQKIDVSGGDLEINFK
jgi:hypothetical protein